MYSGLHNTECHIINLVTCPALQNVSKCCLEDAYVHTNRLLVLRPPMRPYLSLRRALLSLIYGAIRTPCSVRTKAKDVLFIQGKQELMALQASSLALAFGSADDRAQSAESFWAAASCSLHPSRSLSVLCTLKFCTSKFFAVLTCPHLQECSCPSVESTYGDFAN
jgi:hypothetical protein